MIHEIAPQSGQSFKVKKNTFLKIICPEGEQVADLVAYSLHDLNEFISNGKTLDYEENIYLTTGNIIYSNRSSQMLEIIEDTCGRHDFLLAPCCQNTFKKIYNITEKHPSCRENLYLSLEKYGIREDAIPTAFNVFMKVDVDNTGKISVLPPTANPGDYIVFKAHMDLLIGLTSCSAEQSNNYSFKPIQYELLG
ncbi:urea carboxylase-associated family protein [Aurantibacter sp.]|uniref:urea carboxylase-associated family protein n=1 Tax=Aurantibacter sp. TaxID=2807103 RepID=UPI003263E92A